MLAPTSRVTTADDYRAAVRRGARFVAPNTVTYVRRQGEATRFGFIVAKSVGIAVTRNRVRRRLKAACFELLPVVSTEPGGVGADVVIRALPGAAGSTFAALQGEVTRALVKAGLVHGGGVHGGGASS